ncbi:MAG: accessory factor UbiK family protein [Proteobacteria bacterium]|nr:accessory factor UbiK family protein [Pseudomonadota bacterium]
MQSRNRIFDDFARVAGGAAGTLNELREEIENLVRARVERVAGDFNLVSREEFDAVKAVATKARSEQEILEKRVAELEVALSKGSPKKPAAKRTSPKAAPKAAPNE